MFKRIILKAYKVVVGAFEKLVLKERCAHKLALSFCVGLYISFSPFLFMHTAMVIGFSWLFSLNCAAVFAGALVNNPWTIVPVHAAGYMAGEFFLRTICGLDPIKLNPSWMSIVNEPIVRVTGIEGISFWSFMIGGNLLAIIVSVMLYPLSKRVFTNLGFKVYGSSKKSHDTKL